MSTHQGTTQPPAPTPSAAGRSDPAGSAAAVVGPEGSAAARAGTDLTRVFRYALAAIVVLATAVRARLLTVGLPYSSYVDERFVVKASAHQIAHGTWDTGWSWYPSLLADLTSITARVLSLFDHGALTEGARITDRSPYTEVLAPSTLILAGRLVVLASAVGIVWLVGLLGARIAGRRVGVVAALLAAVLPSFVQRSSVILTDTPAAFFAIAVLYGAARTLDDERPRRWATFTGVAAGLALTSKYTTVFAVVALIVALTARTDLSRRDRVACLVRAGIASLLAAVVTMPRLVLRRHEVIDALHQTSDAYGRWNGGVRYVDEAFAPHELGPLVLALGAVGLVVLGTARRSRVITIGYLAFAGVTAALLFGSAFQPFRNLMPVLPFLCIAAATTIVRAGDLAGRALPSAPRAAPALAGAMAALLCLGFLVNWDLPYVRHERDRVDTRVAARRWLEARVHHGDRVVVAEEIGFLPSELARLDGQVTVQSQRSPVSTADARFVVLGTLGEAPRAWLDDLRGQRQAAAFGRVFTSCAGTWDTDPDRDPRCPNRPSPDAWHGNDGTITVYEAPAPA